MYVYIDEMQDKLDFEVFDLYRPSPLIMHRNLFFLVLGYYHQVSHF
jgi:hypothetical protein